MLSRAIAVVLLALAAAPLSSAAAQSSARLTAARQLIVAMQADSAILRTLEATVGLQRKASPQIPKEFWDEFLRRARRDLPMLIDSLAPVYASRFNEAELQSMIQFYQTPVGKKLIASQGKIQEQSMEFGQRWGMRLGTEAGAELEKKGIKLQ